MMTLSVTSKGQIVIPAILRRKYSIKEGTKLNIEEDKGVLVLRPVDKNYFENIAGVLNTKGKLTKALIREREIDRKSEK
jgi:AbrB family looped-hinge helix DNA binding protein